MDALVWAGGLANGLPVVAGIAGWRGLRAGRTWAWAWGLASAAAQVLQFMISRHGPNLWLAYFTTPLEGSLMLMALSCWQDRVPYRRALRWVVVVALALDLLSVRFVEDPRGFSIAAMPTYAILGFAAALFTLVTRAVSTGEPLLTQDWFWVSAGFAVYNGASGVVTPIASALHGDIPALIQTYRVYAVVQIVAYAAVAAGLLCPRHGPAATAMS